MSTAGLAVWSIFRTGTFDIELFEKRYITVQNHKAGLNIIWWTYTGNLDHAKVEIGFEAEVAERPWFPNDDESRSIAWGSALTGGNGSTYSIDRLNISLPFWYMFLLFATYPLLIPVLSYFCRRARESSYSAGLSMLLLLAIMPIMLLLAGVYGYFVHVLFLVVNAPYSVRTSANFISVIVAVILISRFLFSHLVKPFDPMTCDQCGYNLTGNVSGICPECGRESESNPNQMRIPA